MSRFSVLILAVLKLVVRGVTPDDSLVGTDGYDGCKCIDPELQRLARDSVACTTAGKSLKAILNNGNTHCFPDNYGVKECQKWDKVNNPQCALPNGQPRANAPAFCDDSWCYVSPSCPMTKSRTQFFPNAPSLWYSYGTCGGADLFREWTVATYLEQVPLRVKLLDEAEFGMVFPNRPGNHPVGRGALHDVYDMIRVSAKFVYRETAFLPQLGENLTDWDRCLLNVAVGHLDLCLGTFWETQERMENSSFVTPLGVDNFHMVAKKVEEDSFTDQMTGVFKPFTWRLWIMIGVMMLLIGAIIFVVEYRDAGEGHDDFTDQAIVRNGVYSMYLSCLGFWSGGPAHSPSTPAGKMILCSFAVFVMLALSGYTANLASFMVTAKESAAINDIQDIIQKNLKLCLDSPVRRNVIEKYPNIEPHLVIVKMNGYEKLDAGECDAYLAGHDFHKWQLKKKENCNFIMVDKVFFSAMLSQPINVEYQRAMSYWMVKMRAESKLASELKKYEPADSCGGDAEPDSNPFGVQVEGQMDLKDFTGTFCFVAIVMAIGLCVRFCRMGMETKVGQHVSEQSQSFVAEVASRVSISSSEKLDEKVPEAPSAKIGDDDLGPPDQPDEAAPVTIIGVEEGEECLPGEANP